MLLLALALLISFPAHAQTYTTTGFAALSSYRNCINSSFRSRVYLSAAGSIAAKPPAAIAEDAFLDCKREEDLLLLLSKPEEAQYVAAYKAWAKQWFVYYRMAAELPVPSR
jgi:hypothetical protein